MVIFFFWIAPALIIAAYANSKGRSAVDFFVLSLLLSPLIGFLIAAISSPEREEVPERSGLKECPDCAECVQGEAYICRFCGHKFSTDIPAVVSQEDQSQKEQEQIQEQTIATLGRWTPIALAIFAAYIAVFLLVRLDYIAIPIMVVVTAVLLLAFYPQMKRPGPAAHI
jgi:phosphate/sulfate permease